jgi:hypothetical protein
MVHPYILDTKNIYIVLKTAADVTHILKNIHKHRKIEQIKRERNDLSVITKANFLHLLVQKRN